MIAFILALIYTDPAELGEIMLPRIVTLVFFISFYNLKSDDDEVNDKLKYLFMIPLIYSSALLFVEIYCDFVGEMSFEFFCIAMIPFVISAIYPICKIYPFVIKLLKQYYFRK